MMNTHKPGFVTSINYMENKKFASRVSFLVKRPQPGKFSDGVRILWRVLCLAPKGERMLLSSSWGTWHPELMAAAIMGLLPKSKRPSIYLLGCMWEPDRGVRGVLERMIIKLADRAIDRYIVQSTEEMAIFPPMWRVSPGKLRYCPFFYSIRERDLPSNQETRPEEYIFAGGNSMRDYEPMVEAARSLPQHKFIIATNLLHGRDDLPSNFEAKPVSHNQFVSLLYSSSATVVPVKSGLHRAAGQQTYLNAMWLGKPTIVTDTLGVHDHIRHKETGLIVDGSPESYIEALNWVYDPNNKGAVARLNAAAKREVEEKFSFERHIERLLEIMDE